MPRRERLFAVLPTLLTLGNAICGFGAITFAAKVGLEPYGLGRSPTECLWIAAVLVFLAMVFDMLDGRAARWANQTSEFGAELDSLCDAVSFGVAPAVMLIKFTAETHPPMFVARLLWVIAVLYVVCAILRLARFNVETDEEDTHEFFSGLPSPAAAGTVASFMIALPELESLAAESVENANRLDRLIHDVALVTLPALQFVLPVVALACACLMVSTIRYSHVFNQWFRGRRSYRHILRLMLGLAIAVIFKELAVPLVFAWFSFEAPVRAGWRALLPGRPLAAVTPEAAPSDENTPQPPPQVPGSPLAS
ncbi:MAG: CDP-diacylglycerol--serine O-phosphatidyltransferase [Planctomycetes bacterium]|nr:CDP-diacylglycerol--serine O-phosphatidyltransferase [Planctomycetota bacterium]